MSFSPELDAESVMRSWYRDAVHQPYSLTHDGEDAPGALLVHGFTGSPADMRAMADAMHARGIDVHVMVLPGMAGDIHRLNEMTAATWRNAVSSRWREIRSRYDTAILVGYSMGGALSLLAAVDIPPEMLTLVSPLTRLADRRAWLLPIARYFWPGIRPYAGLDWTDDRVHDWFDRARPSMETRNSVNQSVLTKDAVYSTRMLNELRRLLSQARRAAPHVAMPTFIAQGHDDRIVLPSHTRQLSERLGGEVTLHEMPGDHYIPLPRMGSWPEFHRAFVEHLDAWLDRRRGEQAANAR